MREFWHRVVNVLASLRLTLVCLSLTMVLVFVGTLAQVSSSIHDVQARYFESLIVWWPLPGGGGSVPVFPGGHLLIGVLLLNLIAAHAQRFRWEWKKLGIHLIHGGLIILLAGGLLTDFFSVESFMKFAPGVTRDFSESQQEIELAVTDSSASELDTVTTIAGSRLRRGGEIAAPSFPFRILVRDYFANSRVQMLAQAGPGAMPAADHGIGANVAVLRVAQATAPNERNVPSAIIEVRDDAGKSHGTWLVTDQLGAPQDVRMDGKSYRLEMRPTQYYKPFSLTLTKFTHDRYPGTEIPKNFASSAVLTDPERSENREVLITMNHPLRYRGHTFFQSGFDQKISILQVVQNPAFLAPYIACVIVGLGLLVQFSSHFFAFLQRSKATRSAP